MKLSLRSPLIWSGGKGKFLDRIFSHFPQHRTFCDVFGGGGSVVLGKRPAYVDVYNDLDGRLANFFRVLSDEEKVKELQKRLENTLYSRKVWEEAKEFQNKKELSDLDRAYYFFVTNRQSFSGMGEHWGYAITTETNYSMKAMLFHTGINMIKKAHKRLREIQVENLDFKELILKYDDTRTLFYLDPPYVFETRSGSRLYRFEMEDKLHHDLVNLLLNIKGMAILSGYETEIYKPLLEEGWRLDKFDVRVCTTNAGVQVKRPTRTECLWVSPSCLKNRIQNKLFLD